MSTLSTPYTTLISVAQLQALQAVTFPEPAASPLRRQAEPHSGRSSARNPAAMSPSTSRSRASR